MRRILNLFICLLWTAAWPQNYAGEVYLLGYSVSNNGTSGIIPTFHNSPSQAVIFPAPLGNSRLSLETASMPMFGGLAEAISGALQLPLDSNTELNIFGAILTEDEIYERPQLQGTPEQRALDPTRRPGPCANCRELTNVDYPALLNIKRRFNFHIPRMDFSSRIIPMSLGIGINAKYFKSELEGDADQYIAQNINMDAGINLQMHWGWDQATRRSERRFAIDVSGFELLRTNQFSSFAEEPIASRYHFSFFWDESLPKLKSEFRAGVTQRSEWGKWPGVGAEWSLYEILALRGGGDSQSLSGGISLRYRFLAIHYSFVYHELSANPYQFSLELLPLKFFN